MRRLLPLLATLALVASACGGGAGDTTTTTTGTATTAPTTTAQVTTTSAAEACGSVSVPGAASDVTEAMGDVDGDGAVDTLRSYLLAEDDWHLQVALAAGGGGDLAIATFGAGAGAVAVLGGADVDDDGADEVWARTGSGASATILGLARFSDCVLARVTFPGGDPAELPVGGSVGTASGLECEARVDPAAHLTTYLATNVADDQYEVTSTEFALSGSELVEKGSQTTTATAGDDTFARATGFTCDGLSL